MPLVSHKQLPPHALRRACNRPLGLSQPTHQPPGAAAEPGPPPSARPSYPRLRPAQITALSYKCAGHFQLMEQAQTNTGLFLLLQGSIAASCHASFSTGNRSSKTA